MESSKERVQRLEEKKVQILSNISEALDFLCEEYQKKNQY